MNNSPPDSSVYEISQARILEWVAISYSRGSSRPRDQTCVSFMGRWGLHHWAAWKATEPRARISFLLGGGGWGGGILHGMWNLSSLTRDWTHTLCSGSWRQPLNHQGSLKARMAFSPSLGTVMAKALTCPTTWTSYCPSFWSEYELSLYI